MPHLRFGHAPFCRDRIGGALRNAGEEPLAVYVLTVTSGGPLS